MDPSTLGSNEASKPHSRQHRAWRVSAYSLRPTSRGSLSSSMNVGMTLILGFS